MNCKAKCGLIGLGIFGFGFVVGMITGLIMSCDEEEDDVEYVEDEDFEVDENE